MNIWKDNIINWYSHQEAKRIPIENLQTLDDLQIHTKPHNSCASGLNHGGFYSPPLTRKKSFSNCSNRSRRVSLEQNFELPQQKTRPKNHLKNNENGNVYLNVYKVNPQKDRPINKVKLQEGRPISNDFHLDNVQDVWNEPYKWFVYSDIINKK